MAARSATAALTEALTEALAGRQSAGRVAHMSVSQLTFAV